MNRTDERYAGSCLQADFHLHTESWSRLYHVQESHSPIGSINALECYDDAHNALFRIALTEDSELQEFRHWADLLYQRSVPLEEMAAWKRMGRLLPASEATHASVSNAFASSDAFSAPFRFENHHSSEVGFDGQLPLAYAILLDANEEEQELAMTIAGGVGRVAVAMTPRTIQQIAPTWVYAGEAGMALRLNLAAIASYWIGCRGEGANRYSYLEALDVYGDLILRICSNNPDSYRYWKSLATKMDPICR